MAFLNSLLLFGLLAVAVPILIHLFTRQKVKRIPFSTLRFLKELQKQQIRRLKIRQLLLLLLRALFILLLVLAFARPTLNSDAASSNAAITAVIILDNSMSMGLEGRGRTQLETAQELAEQVGKTFRQGDEVHLLTMPPSTDSEPHRSAESLLETIENIRQTYAGTDLSSALAIANQIAMESANINKEVYLITDMQRSGLMQDHGQNGNGATLLDDSIRLFLLPAPAVKATNLTIDSVRVVDQILEKSKVMEVEARIHNTGDEAVSDRLVHLFIDGKRVAQRAVTLEPSAHELLLFKVVPEDTGPQSGYVMLEDDALLMDNRRFFTFEIPDEIRILLVGAQPVDTRFLNLAFKPQEEVGSYITLDNVTAGQLPDVDLPAYDVAVFSNVPRIEPAVAIRLQEFVRTGGGLIVFPGPSVDIRNYNERVHKRLNLPLLTQSARSQREDEFLSLGDIDYSHPIFDGMFEKEKAVESPQFRFTLGVQTTQNSDAIMRYTNRSPFLFEASYQQGKVLYFTSAITTEWSDLVYRGLFVPLVNRSAVYLTGVGNQQEQFLVGASLTSLPQIQEGDAALTLESPDGNATRLKPEITGGNYLVQFSDTRHPGIYRLRAGNRSIAQWAVNFDPGESRLNRFAAHDLREQGIDSEPVVIDEIDLVEEKVLQTRFGRELWKSFALAALLVLVVETVLLKERNRVASGSGGKA